MRVPSDLTIEEWDKINRGIKRGFTIAEMARALDVKVDSLQTTIRRRGIEAEFESPLEDEELEFGLVDERPLGTAIGDQMEPEKETVEDGLRRQITDARVDSDRREIVYKAELKYRDRKYQSALRIGATQDTLISVLRETVTPFPRMSMEPLTIPTGVYHGLHTVVGMLSDWHVGEFTDDEVMDGLGGYDLQTFRQRVGLWVRKFLYLMEIERSQLEIPRLTLLVDGDMVSGLIHEELIKTNQLNMVDQMKEAAFALAWAIAQVSRHFEEVTVSCTVGNHGRNQKQTEYKEPYVNWDYMAYQYMAMLLRDYDHINIEIPKGLFAVTPIENMRFLHFHGHGIKSWNSIPYYGIDRAIKNLRETFQAKGDWFDGVAIAHFHVPFETTSATGPLLVNGCMKGGDEFALFGLNKWVPASQTMFVVHEEHGYVSRRLIYLQGSKPSDAVDYEIAGVWSRTVI